jgi:hypothetical protein
LPVIRAAGKLSAIASGDGERIIAGLFAAPAAPVGLE